MNIAAIGGIVLAIFAAVAGLCMVAYQAGKRTGVEEYLNGRAELRAQRRAETRITRRSLASFPGDDELFERKPADTGELRELSAMAEAGELDRIKGENAAFFRTWDLRQWTRKRETAA